MFGVLDFLWTISCEPECCTARECEQKGGKSSKKERKPGKVEETFKTYRKQEFGKDENKRKRPAAEHDACGVFQDEKIDLSELVKRLEGLNHSTGLKKILETCTGKSQLVYYYY